MAEEQFEGSALLTLALLVLLSIAVNSKGGYGYVQLSRRGTAEKMERTGKFCYLFLTIFGV